MARERLIAARLALGEAALLVPDLEAMVAEEPLREERWRLLVLALYRAHRQADALGALRRARTTLADELGVDPGPALRELEEQVLAQSPFSSSRPRGPARRRRSRPAAPATVRVPDDLLDRDREIAAVRAALDDLAAGEPRPAADRGARPASARAGCSPRRGAWPPTRSVRVLTARGSQLEKAFGFGAVRQLFEPALGSDERPGGAARRRGRAARGRVFDLAPGGAARTARSPCCTGCTGWR